MSACANISATFGLIGLGLIIVGLLTMGGVAWLMHRRREAFRERRAELRRSTDALFSRGLR